jgi:hypothetical protein
MRVDGGTTRCGMLHCRAEVKPVKDGKVAMRGHVSRVPHPIANSLPQVVGPKEVYQDIVSQCILYIQEQVTEPFFFFFFFFFFFLVNFKIPFSWHHSCRDARKESRLCFHT